MLIWLFVLALCAVFCSLAWNRYQVVKLTESALINEQAYNQSKQTIEQLTQVQESLFSNLDQRQNELRMLDSRLVDLELLAGTETSEYLPELAQRIKQTRISLYEKQLLLSKIPNGKPMDYSRVSSKFGLRVHPITNVRQTHVGMDLRAESGTPIFATADGFVEKARKNYDQGYGNMISLRHQMGFNTRYAHLKTVLVEFGQYVKKGELLGYCGNTGDSTAPHLHYEVLFLDKVLDPEPFMALSLTNYEQVTQKIRTVPWESFQQEIRLLSQLPAPRSSQQEHASRVPLNSAVTFMSMAK